MLVYFIYIQDGSGEGEEEKAEAMETEEAGEGEIEEAEEEKTPTHYSKLDLKTMKVMECRYELEARGLISKGMKAQLVARLSKILKQEQEESEENTDDQQEDGEATDVEGDDQKEKDTTSDKDATKASAEKTTEEVEKVAEDTKEPVKKKELQLPSEPYIFVHPSPVAKNGKFSCTMMSLSVLLDYRQDDNKEHSFEVSLFAELFNEMLMRDFGFKIYRAINAVPEPEESKEKEKEKSSDKEKDKKNDSDVPAAKKRKTDDDEAKDEKDNKKEDNKSDSTSSKKDEEKEKKKDWKDDDKKDDHSSSRRSRDSKDKDRESKDKDRESKDKDRERDVKVPNMKTTDPSLLLSCVYFDLNRCDYIAEKDTEEILHTIGLQISRSQVRKLVKRVSSKEQFNYRKLTDEPEVKGEEKLDSHKEADVVVDVDVLARANEVLTEAPLTESPSKTPSKSKKAVTSSTGEDVSMVTYRGATIDIGSVLRKLEQAEAERAVLEGKVSSLTNEIESARNTHTKDVTTISALQSQVTGLETSTSASDKSYQKIRQSAVSLARFVQSVTSLALEQESVVQSVLTPSGTGSSASTNATTSTDTSATVVNGESRTASSSRGVKTEPEA